MRLEAAGVQAGEHLPRRAGFYSADPFECEIGVEIDRIAGLGHELDIRETLGAQQLFGNVQRCEAIDDLDVRRRANGRDFGRRLGCPPDSTRVRPQRRIVRR